MRLGFGFPSLEFGIAASGFGFRSARFGFVPPDLDFRPRFKRQRSPSPGDGRRLAPIQNLLAEQAMNDYALFAICLGKIAILDSSASFIA
jgi:hypothetical protein